MTNALKDLLSLIPECVPYPLISTSFEWYEEPGGTGWRLERRNNKEVVIKMVSYEDMSPKKEIGIEFNEVCQLDELVTVAVKEMELLLKKHGVEGLQRNLVNYEFPYSEYLALKKYIMGKIVQ